MKIKLTASSILDSCFCYELVESLLNFFAVEVEDIHDYSELCEKERQVMKEDIFHIITIDETINDRIERCFSTFEPKEFGIITIKEFNEVCKILKISKETENLQEIRNNVVKYYSDKENDGTITKENRIKMLDKMSAIVGVIDTLKFSTGKEV